LAQTVDRTRVALNAVTAAWLITSIYYFYQYVLRSAPAVMVPELTDAFGVTAAGLTSLLGLFYYGYAIFSLVAGVALDQLGPRLVVPIGAAIVGAGAFLFATGDASLAGIGRLLQGVGGVFALIGAVYLVTTQFPSSRAATFIGATQMFGMAGGSAGQFLVGPAVASGIPWNKFWLFMGAAGFVISMLLFFVMPSREAAGSKAPGPSTSWARNAVTAMWAVFRNPQSLLCGLIAGLMFVPTTIFDMVWGVRFLQESHAMPYAEAVLRSASVPFGWIIGCPLLGAVSDRIGRRKPVILGSAAVLLGALLLILYSTPDTFPAYGLGLVAGIASGAAMLLYTVIQEANRPEYRGTATGVINFINFSFSALLGPVLGSLLLHMSAGGPRALEHYQTTFSPLAWGVGLAILLTLFLRETGPAANAASVHATRQESQTKGRHLAGS
jgi:MFS family permease